MTDYNSVSNAEKQGHVQMIIDYVICGEDFQFNDNFGILTRCGKCIHWKPGVIDEKDNFYAPQCKLLNMPIHAWDYCSHAKRAVDRL